MIHVKMELRAVERKLCCENIKTWQLREYCVLWCSMGCCCATKRGGGAGIEKHSAFQPQFRLRRSALQLILNRSAVQLHFWILRPLPSLPFSSVCNEAFIAISLRWQLGIKRRKICPKVRTGPAFPSRPEACHFVNRSFEIREIPKLRP